MQYVSEEALFGFRTGSSSFLVAIGFVLSNQMIDGAFVCLADGMLSFCLLIFPELFCTISTMSKTIPGCPNDFTLCINTSLCLFVAVQSLEKRNSL